MDNEKVDTVTELDESVEALDDLDLDDSEESTVDLSDTLDEKFEDKPKAKVEAEKPKAEKTTEHTGDEKQWDKERQRADQAEANFRREQRSRQEIAEQARNLDEKVKVYESQLEKLAKANEVNVDDIDSEFVDPKVKLALKTLQNKIDSVNKKADDLEKTKQRYEQNEREARQNELREQSKTEILSDIESDYPAKFRNDAIKLANDEVANGKFGKDAEGNPLSPPDSYSAAKLLRQQYKKLADSDKTPRKTVAADSGKGGSVAGESSEAKKTTFGSVVKEWKLKLKGK